MSQGDPIPGMRQLRQHYPAPSPKKAVNRAIRAECPGGDLAIDGLTRFSQRARAHPDDLTAKRAADVLAQIVDAMGESLLARYAKEASP